MIPSTPMKRESRPARIAFSDTITNEKANGELSGQRDRLDHDEPAVVVDRLDRVARPVGARRRSSRR